MVITGSWIPVLLVRFSSYQIVKKPSFHLQTRYCTKNLESREKKLDFQRPFVYCKWGNLLREDDSFSSVDDSAFVFAPIKTSLVEAESNKQLRSPWQASSACLRNVSFGKERSSRNIGTKDAFSKVFKLSPGSYVKSVDLLSTCPVKEKNGEKLQCGQMIPCQSKDYKKD